MESEMINVIHISTEKTWRGGEQQIANLIESLDQTLVKSYVFVLKNSAFHQYLKTKNFDFQTFNSRFIFNLFTIFSLKKFAKKSNANLIHLHTGKAHWLGVLLNFLGFKIPLILSRRVDFEIKNNFLSNWKYNHKSIKKILCVSNAIQKIIAPNIKDKNKLTTVYSGIDIEKWQNPVDKTFLKQAFNITADYKIVGNIAALEDHKDLFTFIKVAKNLASEKIKFLIIGKGSLESELKVFAQKLQLKNLIFTGYRDDISKILPCFDAFLFTSKKEGLGTILLDAMAAKIPIIATNAGGISELIENEHTGYLAEVKNNILLSEMVLKTLNQNNSKTIQNAFKKVKLFSKSQTATNTLQVYYEMTN